MLSILPGSMDAAQQTETASNTVVFISEPPGVPSRVAC